MNTETKQEWRKKEVWDAFIEDKIYVSIHHWGQDLSVYEGAGQWNYYLNIYESKVENFEEWWLEDKVSEYGSVSHDYYGLPVDELELHGGITYYAKHGHTVGKRRVEIGCDYGHYGEIGRIRTPESVQREALRSAELLMAQLKFKETPVPV